MTDNYISVLSVGSTRRPSLLFNREEQEQIWQIIDYFISLTIKGKKGNLTTEIPSNILNKVEYYTFGKNTGEENPKYPFYSTPTNIKKDFEHLDIYKKEKENLFWNKEYFDKFVNIKDYSKIDTLDNDEQRQFIADVQRFVQFINRFIKKRDLQHLIDESHENTDDLSDWELLHKDLILLKPEFENYIFENERALSSNELLFSISQAVKLCETLESEQILGFKPKYDRIRRENKDEQQDKKEPKHGYYYLNDTYETFKKVLSFMFKSKLGEGDIILYNNSDYMKRWINTEGIRNRLHEKNSSLWCCVPYFAWNSEEGQKKLDIYNSSIKREIKRNRELIQKFGTSDILKPKLKELQQKIQSFEDEKKDWKKLIDDYNETNRLYFDLKEAEKSHENFETIIQTFDEYRTRFNQWVLSGQIGQFPGPYEIITLPFLKEYNQERISETIKEIERKNSTNFVNLRNYHSFIKSYYQKHGYQYWRIILPLILLCRISPEATKYFFLGNWKESIVMKDTKDSYPECGVLLAHLVDIVFKTVTSDNFSIPLHSGIKSVNINPIFQEKKHRLPGTLEIETDEKITIIFDIQYTFSKISSSRQMIVKIRNDPPIWQIMNKE